MIIFLKVHSLRDCMHYLDRNPLAFYELVDVTLFYEYKWISLLHATLSSANWQMSMESEKSDLSLQMSMN